MAVGAKLWLVRPLGFRIDDAHLRRAGMDYWQHLAWQAVDDWDALVAALPGSRRWLFTKKAQRSYLEVAYQHGDVLVFGSESTGLPDGLLAAHAAKSASHSRSARSAKSESLQQRGRGCLRGLATNQREMKQPAGSGVVAHPEMITESAATRFPGLARIIHEVRNKSASECV